MCVKFHDEENRLEIIGGASCLYDEIQKWSIQNEDANFKGKTKPFTHTILGGATFMAGAVEPMMYVGIKVVLKDNSVLPIYAVSAPAAILTDLRLAQFSNAPEPYELPICVTVDGILTLVILLLSLNAPYSIVLTV